MNPTFVFSLDRETWMGEFPSRQAAAAEGIRKARQHPDSIATVYVGQKIFPSPRAYGHARDVLHTMARRVKDDNGDAADEFLRGVTEPQIMDLDHALEMTILDWLGRNDLSPSFFRVESISEHPVPIASFEVNVRPARSSASETEVKDLGVSEYPIGS
jgi:hypothetical protein